MTLEQKLEDFKQIGHYEVVLRFGEETGLDDLDIPLGERRVRLMGVPVGVLGEARRAFVGSLKELLEFDFGNSGCQLLSNPPSREDVADPGYYMWGTDRAMETLTS